jgi:hypothetical protein
MSTCTQPQTALFEPPRIAAEGHFSCGSDPERSGFASSREKANSVAIVASGADRWQTLLDDDPFDIDSFIWAVSPSGQLLPAKVGRWIDLMLARWVMPPWQAS